MRYGRVAFIGALGAIGMVAARPVATSPGNVSSPTVAQFLSAASPIEVVAATKVDRIAWIAYEEGRRNVYTAAAPAFLPVRLTKFLKDDGVDLTGITISADGSTVAFVRGSAANREGWNANPSSDPNGGEQAIWAARSAAPGVSWRVAPGSSPELSPDGRSVLFVQGGQIYRALLTSTRPVLEMDRGEKPFIREWGVNTVPRWSPDGRRIAFVSTRNDHSLIGVYDVALRTVRYLAPSVDRDTSPTWSADSARIVFVRRPGTPFGQQAQPGGRGLGVPGGPAAGQNGRAAASPRGGSTAVSVPGLMTATFRGGYTVSLWMADAATAEAHEFWHNEPGEATFTNINNIRWAGDAIVFPLAAAGGGRGGRGAAPAGGDEWDRYYGISVATRNAAPIMLTTTDGLIEDRTSVAFSADGKTFFYCTNAKDIERRHIWAVATSGGTPHQVTLGAGIETFPAPLASGKTLATLSADAKMPQSLGIWSMTSSTQRIVFPTSRPAFPMDAEVVPELVLTHAEDGLEVHNQLFLPKDTQPGQKHPAMVFVHGGPIRQMLLGYHYRYVYHMFYAVNEWLASQGYVVLSINYRSGIGYGRRFQTAPNTEARGNAEYQDVVAGAKYLQSRPDVDSKRIGIYGLSYGGLLTAQALSRNSDLFAAGVDYAGVHLYGSSLDPNDLSYQSSAISQIDKWKSPVLLIQGDDDRNVYFAQTVGLVQLLRQRDVYYELVVFPDDVHDSLLHSRWLYLLGRMDSFLHRFLGEGTPSPR
jgi:dipeptidyl-peptidase-4